MDEYLLGIDNGGTVIKASIFDTCGKEVAVSRCKTRFQIPEPGFSVLNMEDLWEANICVIREVISKSGLEPGLIRGLSVTGHGNGLYLIDGNGKPAYSGIYSSDNRAKDIVSTWYKNGVFDRVHPLIMQAVWAGQPVALLAWLKRYCPKVLDNSKWILMCKDYIRYRLTGEVYAEITDLSGANLINGKEKKYDKELLREFGLEELLTKLPPIKYSSDICGYITPEVEALMGLKAGTPVAGGMFDIDACAIASGIVNEDKFCIAAGTWSINEYISRKPEEGKDLFLNTLYCIDGFNLVTEASPTSASNLEWFVEQFYKDNENALREKSKSLYEMCDEMVEKIEPEESKIIFLPFLFGSNVEADAKSCFIGLKGCNKKAHLLRAVYEGVVFCHLYHIEKLMALRPRPKTVRLTGGAARSKVWVQMFADALQIPVEIVHGSELGTLGAAICAGVATKAFSSFEQAVEKMVGISHIVHPNQDKKEIYEKKYSVYKKTLQQLAPIWAELD